MAGQQAAKSIARLAVSAALRRGLGLVLVSLAFFEPGLSAASRILPNLVFSDFGLIVTPVMRGRNEPDAGAAQVIRESDCKLRQIIETAPGFRWSTGRVDEPTHVDRRMLDDCGMRFEDFKHRGWGAFGT